jgi:hypothetical protein
MKKIIKTNKPLIQLITGAKTITKMKKTMIRQDSNTGPMVQDASPVQLHYSQFHV